jgi:hypothetical protein
VVTGSIVRKDPLLRIVEKWEEPASVEKKQTRENSRQWPWRPPERRAGESELLDILQGETIVGVLGFDWDRLKNGVPTCRK